MTELKLLVGSEAFWRRAAADCATASRRLLVQAMTFEGDDVGQMVAGAIAASPARDRRVLVDAYSKVVVSDPLGRPGSRVAAPPRPAPPTPCSAAWSAPEWLFG